MVHFEWLHFCESLMQMFLYVQTSSTTSDPREERYSNCRQLLSERLQVQWELQRDMVQIQLAARMREDQYMAFGLSGEQGRSSMVGGDVAVAFYDSSQGLFRVEDYYMSATAQVKYFYILCSLSMVTRLWAG